MARWPRRILRWTLIGVVAAIGLIALDALALSFPYPLFPHATPSGEFTVRSSEPLPADTRRMVDDLRARLAAMDGATPGEGCRVFVCGSQRLYAVFCVLARRPSRSMAFGLSVLNVAYLNQTRIAEMAGQSGGRLPHSRFDGKLDGAVAHEVAHFHMVDRLGFRGALELPLWKSEGWADYQAHLAPMAADSAATLAGRVAVLEDHRYWGTRAPFFHDLYEWQVMVQYLADVEGVTLPELAAPSLTESAVRRRMFAWHESGP